MENFVQLAIDAYKGRGTQANYSADDTQKVLREELIAMNGGSDKLNKKALRDHPEMFSKIEQVITIAREDGFKDNEFFMDTVDYHNIANGDTIEFAVEDDIRYVVDPVAKGTRGLRRQRINGVHTVTPTMTVYGARIYDELDRVFANSINFNDLITRVSNSMIQNRYARIYDAFNKLGSYGDLDETKTKTGTYAENDLIDLCSDLETEFGNVTIFGTKKALSKVAIDTVASNADAAKNDKYNGLYYSRFHGWSMVGVKNVLKPGTTTKALADNKIYVFAGNDRPIKFVTSGDTLIDIRTGTDNADLTQEYTALEEFGICVPVTRGFGVYTLS